MSLSRSPSPFILSTCHSWVVSSTGGRSHLDSTSPWIVIAIGDMALLSMDDPSLELIIRLQLEDADSLVENEHVKGGKNDDTAVFQIYRSELRALEADRRLCEIIARGEEPGNSDDNVPMDSEPALVFRGQRQSSPDPRRTTTAEAEDDEEEDIYSAPAEEASVKEAPPNEMQEARDTDELWPKIDKPRQESPIQGVKTPECVACSEVSNHALVTGLSFAHCPCDHWYCSDCLSALFIHSLTDESLFPPRCCTVAIPVDDFQEFLTPPVVKQFHEKEVEYNTLDRTYCHQLECSAFIPAPMQEQNVSCPACSEWTCTSCKGVAHEGEDCPEDSSSKEILQLARERGWQRCFNCHRMVELNTGCNHISEFSSPLATFLGVCSPFGTSLPMRSGVLLPLRRTLEELSL